MNPVQKATIVHYLLGGASLGAAAGGASVLARRISRLQSEAAREEERRKDKDVTVISTSPGEYKVASVTHALGATGGVLSAMSAYALVDALYDEYRRKELNKQLKKEEQRLNALLHRSVKRASKATSGRKDLSTFEHITTGAAMIPLLLMLASARLSYAYMDKNFPNPNEKLKRPKRKKPIMVMNDTVGGTGEKSARLDEDRLLLDTALTLEQDGDLSAMLKCAAAGKTTEAVQALYSMDGWEGIHNLAATLEPVGLSKAAKEAVKIQVLDRWDAREPVVQMASAIIYDRAPDVVKLAGALEDKTADMIKEIGLESASLSRAKELDPENMPEEELEEAARLLPAGALREENNEKLHQILPDGSLQAEVEQQNDPDDLVDQLLGAT